MQVNHIYCLKAINMIPREFSLGFHTIFAHSPSPVYEAIKVKGNSNSQDKRKQCVLLINAPLICGSSSANNAQASTTTTLTVSGTRGSVERTPCPGAISVTKWFPRFPAGKKKVSSSVSASASVSTNSPRRFGCSIHLRALSVMKRTSCPAISSRVGASCASQTQNIAAVNAEEGMIAQI